MALDLAQYVFASLGQLRFHPTAKRIRAFTGTEVVVDSAKAWLVWEPGRIVPSFAVPVDDIRGSLLESPPAAADDAVRPGDGLAVLDPRTHFSLHTAPGQAFDVATDRSILAAAAFVPNDPDCEGRAILDFEAFDEWREEDELLVGHARDPFKTVDTRRSSRRVTVEIAGTTVADSIRTTILFETFLPTRYYFVPADVRMDLLERSGTVSVCAYKGHANYWSANIGGVGVKDVAWSYEGPHNYATAVRGMLSFFNERVDLYVDGVHLETPRTRWS